jgi:hypothetical protein
MKKKQLPISRLKLKNFRNKIKKINDQELELRASLKLLYDQFVLDVEDNETAVRYVRQAFFQIQKYRVQKQLAERMEFHPFFGANPMSSHYLKEFDGEFGDEENDDDIL